MPLLVFPGGYGGMVWADQRPAVALLLHSPGRAGQAPQIKPGPVGRRRRCTPIFWPPARAAAAAIGDASLQGDWLAAGPIRPGIRARYADDIFRVGNLAGESHPIIAEGISMALQSGWMLAQQLAVSRSWGPEERAAAGKRYSTAWSKQFSARIRMASLLARLSILPMGAAVMRTFVRALPASLSIGATLSGKTKALPGANFT